MEISWVRQVALLCLAFLVKCSIIVQFHLSIERNLSRQGPQVMLQICTPYKKCSLKCILVQAFRGGQQDIAHVKTGKLA